MVVLGARALAGFETGRLNQAAAMAGAAYAQARRLGFDRHFFAITERRRPMYEFLALLDRAQIWAARGQVREALSTVAAARQILGENGSVPLTRADELQARPHTCIRPRSTT